MGCEWSQSRHQSKRAKHYQYAHGDVSKLTGTENVPAPAGRTAWFTAFQTGTQTKQSHSAQQQQQHPSAQQAPATAKPKLDPKDFMFSGLQGQTRVKLPGSVQGQQFVIENCQDCDLFVLDHCASVTIDDCTNCRVLIGPTEASVFLRDCSNCTLAAISRQLRCRDCSDCKLLLLCRTRPIIETCSAMAFGCYDAPYAGLAAQMAAANLNPFHNFYSDVYDFTPAGHTSAGTAEIGASTAAAAAVQAPQPNWWLLPETASVQQLLANPQLPAAVQSMMGLNTAEAQSVAAADVSVAAIGPVSTTCTAPPATASSGSASSSGGADAGCIHSKDSGSAVQGVGSQGAAAGGLRDSSVACQEPLLQAAAAAAVVSPADCMCVVHTLGNRAVCRGPGVVPSSSSCCAGPQDILFVLFPAGQHASALQWVHGNIPGRHSLLHQHQQHQDHTPAVEPQQEEHSPVEPVHDADSGSAQVAADGCGASCDKTDSSGVAAQQADADACEKAVAAVLLHTNAACIPAGVLDQLATAAGWTKQQMKQLVASAGARPSASTRTNGASACVGLEVMCSSSSRIQQLKEAAEVVGALCCTSVAAARLFRDLGMDG